MTNCHDLLQKFLTGTLPEPQLTRLKTWLEMMKNGAVKGRGLSKPEERIIYQYIFAGTDDVKNFKPQYHVGSSGLMNIGFQAFIFLMIILAVVYVALSPFLATESSSEIMPITSEVVVLNDGTIARFQSGSQLFYHEDNVARNIALTGEAWFEAACDPSKPLVVSCGSTHINVDFIRFYLINDDRGGEIIGL